MFYDTKLYLMKIMANIELLISVNMSDIDQKYTKKESIYL